MIFINYKERIENLDYYTSLSLSEKDTKDLEILDEFGNNRFKNGFVVDILKISNQLIWNQLTILVVLIFQILLCDLPLKCLIIRLLYNPYESTTRRCGDLITIPFTEVPFIEQLKATETMNLQPFEVFIWKGDLKLFQKPMNGSIQKQNRYHC